MVLMDWYEDHIWNVCREWFLIINFDYFFLVPQTIPVSVILTVKGDDVLFLNVSSSLLGICSQNVDTILVV